MTQALRNAPRISINALSEYLTSPAGRRRVILAEQKRPKAFQVAYYAIAQGAIVASWMDGLDETPLDHVIEQVRRTPVRKPWDAARADATIYAIESFRLMKREGEIPRLGGLRSVPKSQQSFTVAGVSVSTRPELAFSDSEDTLGAVKLYLSKSTPLSDDRADYASALLRMSFDAGRSTKSTKSNSDSFVLDVFGKSLHSAPSSFRRRCKDIEAACSEIASSWDDV